MLRKRTNPNIKDFKFDKKKSLFINPVVPEAKSSAGELYIYSLTVGHLWIIKEVKSLGFGDFIKDLILFAKRNKVTYWFPGHKEGSFFLNIYSRNANASRFWRVLGHFLREPALA
ncbi:hypothetical protein A943_14365 [Bacillus sp. CPSM8]|uniref:hypothetical protein n=1 Tax=unclassified Bacillus (in: firmicutes) TaxID=185979 RepID=UPI0003D212C7|nr:MULTISPECIES: hypothetical protein [unclassified Bacillus (in: firmicutes)]ETB70573.1 hypothetical protein A943_14365 [Bacillus sp. CPSM8]